LLLLLLLLVEITLYTLHRNSLMNATNTRGRGLSSGNYGKIIKKWLRKRKKHWTWDCANVYVSTQVYKKFAFMLINVFLIFLCRL